MSSKPQKGRLRTTDDSHRIIGSNINVTQGHKEQMNETKKKKNELATRQGHRRLLNKLMIFWRENYPEYFEVGTRVITQEEVDNDMLFYYPRQKNYMKRDLVYQGINVNLVLAFFGGTKIKTDGSNNIYSHVHFRKFNDAILFGASALGQNLPSEYYTEMDTFLSSYRNEVKIAKKNGQVDENKADKIPYTLLCLFVGWALDQGNIFIWVWSILQWHLMGRAISIDPLSLHNLKLGEDHIIIKHDSTKMDKGGQKLIDKHCYANPKDPQCCLNTSLGIWLCLEQDNYEHSEFLFRTRGTKNGTASNTYCDQLTELLRQHNLEVLAYAAKASAHSIRKGSATAISSGTTLPPLIASIAACGDWSLGFVLGIYWQFSDSGDYYLGRSLTMIDINSDDFAILPPHFLSTYL